MTSPLGLKARVDFSLGRFLLDGHHSSWSREQIHSATATDLLQTEFDVQKYNQKFLTENHYELSSEVSQVTCLLTFNASQEQVDIWEI